MKYRLLVGFLLLLAGCAFGQMSFFGPNPTNFASADQGVAATNAQAIAMHANEAASVARFSADEALFMITNQTYPVILLPMGGPWTDFELKASTNNFDSTNGLVYYLISSATNVYADDTNAWVYFTDDYDQAHPHRWRTATNATPIAQQLLSTNSEVGCIAVFPSHKCSKAWDTWMSSTNSVLIWSYVRFDGVDFERNSSGSSQRWTLVVPQWRSKRTGPNGESDPP